MISREILSAIGAKGVANILDQLAGGPRRPSELSRASGVSEPTSFSRIKSLKKSGVITECIVYKGERSYKGYKLTPAGERILETLSGGGE
jgi:DNA-binding HxlR family transcriptional regulator